MSLATLNKQRAAEKHQPQSIKTTVTISSVSKTPVGSTTPIMNESKQFALDNSSSQSEPSIGSSDSPRTIREISKSPEIIQAVEEVQVIGKKKELAKEKFMNEAAEVTPPRRGKKFATLRDNAVDRPVLNLESRNYLKLNYLKI